MTIDVERADGREGDRLQTVIARATQDDDGDFTLIESDYVWLICEVSRLRGWCEGIEMAWAWEKRGRA